MNNHNKYKETCLDWARTLLGLEMFLEDIPQLVLTVMVLNARNGGAWSPVAVFNATTSGFNFAFNLLDMFMPLEEEHFDNKKKNDDHGRKSSHGNIGKGTSGIEMGRFPNSSVGTGSKDHYFLNEGLVIQEQQDVYRLTSSSFSTSGSDPGYGGKRMVWT